MRLRLSYQRGFSLIEVLVSLTVGAVVLVLAAHMLAVVMDARARLTPVDAHAARQNFFRSQLMFLDPYLTQTRVGTAQAPGTLMFVTRTSAQYGKSSAPVLVLYRLENNGVIAYREVVLKRPVAAGGGRYEMARRLRQGGDAASLSVPVWRADFLSGVARAEFLYSLDGKTWQPQWTHTQYLPTFIRLDYTLAADGRTHQVLVNLVDLSWSSRSD